MTFAEMQAETSRRLAEVSGRVFWSDDDIAEAVNLGYTELSDATEWFEAYFEMDLLNDRPYYDLRTVIGDSFLALRPAWDEQSSRWLLPASVRMLDAHDRRWEGVTGEPQRFVLRGLWWLGLYPRIQSDVGLIKQYYTALPDPLDADDDEPGFPEAFHIGCVEFATADLFAQDGETKWALAAWSQYLRTEAALTAWVEGRASGPLMRGFDGPLASVQR
jgi:hypothetical protein